MPEKPPTPPSSLADPLADVIWNALGTTQAHLGLTAPLARKYRAEVAPFAALADNSSEALSDLHSLLAPGESVFYINEFGPLSPPGLHAGGSVVVAQMTYPGDSPLPATDQTGILPLSCADSAEMLELIAIAFPGLFRKQTCLMGPYAGIRDPLTGRLIAMAGDRFCLQLPGSPEWREISGVCTHPDFAGKGLASRLLTHKLQEHRSAAVRSLLHVAAENQRAIAIYERLGFTETRRFTMQRITRD